MKSDITVGVQVVNEVNFEEYSQHLHVSLNLYLVHQSKQCRHPEKVCYVQVNYLQPTLVQMDIN